MTNDNSLRELEEMKKQLEHLLRRAYRIVGPDGVRDRRSSWGWVRLIEFAVDEGNAWSLTQAIAERKRH